MCNEEMCSRQLPAETAGILPVRAEQKVWPPLQLPGTVNMNSSAGGEQWQAKLVATNLYTKLKIETVQVIRNTAVTSAWSLAAPATSEVNEISK